MERLCSLLQGCPMSMLLLASVMTCLAHHIHTSVPEARFGAYVDDSIIWAVGQRAMETMERAESAAAQFYDDAKWVRNEDKGCCFGIQEFLSNNEKRRLHILSTKVGKVQTDFINLGVAYSTNIGWI